MNRRSFIQALALTATAPALAQHAVAAEKKLSSNPSGVYKASPKCWRAGTQLEFGGTVGNYIGNVTDNWLKVAPLSNPAMLDMFRDRDRLPRRDLLPWSGEFAGKYLTAAVQVYRCRRDPTLRVFLEKFVAQLITCQAEDGYFGPWPHESRLTGRAPNVGKNGSDTWDAWSHYHVMLGLLLWFDETGDAPALRAAERIGDLFCKKFEATRLVDTGSTEMNLAPIHSLCLLYNHTKAERYLRLAEKIRDEFAATNPSGKPLAGDYLNAALAGREFFQTPKPRWESLHPIMGLAELYWITGEDRYRQAFENIWWSIVKLDRHNNGGFSSGEQAQGNPYHPGAIETCCTIAWMAMSVEMLRMTQSSIVADELELSTLNSVIGLHSPTGRWVTYNTPMDGERKASAHDIVFQARAGSPELNCCSVNGARGFGMLSDWAIMANERGLILNWYGPSILRATHSGVAITFRQENDYPRNGRVRIIVEPERTQPFTLFLRIPHWSKNTEVQLNHLAVRKAEPGTYLEITREWKRGDEIELLFDFSLHFWAGERECANKASIYRGPILLTYDRRFNQMDPDKIPSLDAKKLTANLVAPREISLVEPMLLVELPTADGAKLFLCDFGSAGSGGSPYRSWLRAENAPRAEFSHSNPLRSRAI